MISPAAADSPEHGVLASIAIYGLDSKDQLPVIRLVREILDRHQLHPQVGPMATLIDGPMARLLAAVAECRQQAHAALGIQKLEIQLCISSRAHKPVTAASRLAECPSMV